MLEDREGGRGGGIWDSDSVFDFSLAALAAAQWRPGIVTLDHPHNEQGSDNEQWKDDRITHNKAPQEDG